MRYLQLLAVFTRAELQYALEYRANLILVFAEELVIVASSFTAVLVLFSHTDVMNGWTLPEMTVLLGVFYLIQGIQAVFLAVSFERFMEHVRLGTLDFILIKPVDSQFMISTRHIQLAQLAQVLLGAVVLGLGLARMGERVTPVNALIFAATMGCGVLLVYSLLLVLSTLAFWFVRVENLLAVFWSFIDAGRFPIDIYPGWLRVTLSTVVPIGIAVTVPAQAISGRAEPFGLSLMGIATVVAWLFAGWFWRQGVRNYTGASA
ncbi:MAG: ABC-2 family transporter protein [Chloroflexi bacterium]|nr:ABC-2 family transporter protein [Chloroflexota bacterium]